MSEHGQRPAFSNTSNKIRLSIDQLYEQLNQLTGGWPKCIAGQLTYLADGEPQPIRSAAALIAYIDKFAEVSWHRNAVTKEELYEGLLQRADRYDWMSSYPHFPALPGVYYNCKSVKAKKTGALDKLVGLFRPATDHDRTLITAMVMSLYWGGPAGERPVWTITSRPGANKERGRGYGKTRLVEKLASLVGGVLALRPKSNEDRTLTQFLSPSAMPLRVALVDNLKSYRFSSDLIESLMTCKAICGHRLFHGYASRPNYLTYAVTVNGAAYSKDMAQRTIVIYLDRHDGSPGWERNTADYIASNRESIEADVCWHLNRPAAALTKVPRWHLWHAEVLGRLPNAQALVDLMRKRQAEIDEDDHDADELVEHIGACLQAALPKISLRTAKVEIPTLLAIQWVRRLKTHFTDRQAATFLAQLHHPRLVPYRRSKVRGYTWVGAQAGDEPVSRELAYKVSGETVRRQW